MNRGDWQFVASTFLALALGIPAIQTLASGDASLIALTILITTVGCGGVAYAWYRLHLPLLTIHSVGWIVTLEDGKGQRARIRKTVTLWANHPGADTVVHRGNGSDGRITAFRTDTGVTGLHQESEIGGITVRVRFPNTLPVGARTTTWLEADHENGFTRDSEYFLAEVNYPMKKLTVEINFPDARLPKRMLVVRRYAAKDSTLVDSPTNDRRVSWICEPRFSRVPFGEYQVRWWW